MKNHRILAFATLLLALTLTPALNIAHAATDTVFINLANPTPANDNIIAINQSGDYIITGTAQNRIVVAPNVTANITLRNVSITSQDPPLALDTHNCVVTLRLEGENTLQSTDSWSAALQAADNAVLTINGPGSLTAISRGQSAGIGSGARSGNGGSITINSGTITAINTDWGGAGIGGGTGGNGGNILINGGTIIATGGEYSAGIGGGYYAGEGNITITGGTIIATGGEHAAGIGGGRQAPDSGGNITITGGTITATGGDGGAGIGGGIKSQGGIIHITGGVVMAIAPAGNGDPAAIGGGGAGSPGNITISGGTIYAYGESSSPGIGGGASITDGSISITGGTVIADAIGISTTSGRTPVSITGDSTVVLADTINLAANANVGNAQVQTGVTLSLELMQTMAANAAASAAIDDTIIIWHAKHDTLPLPDTTIHDTARLHDTIYYTGTDSVHDTMYCDPDSVHDTLHVDVEVHDTLTDTLLIYDTLYVADTLRAEAEVFDTTHIPIDIYDTTRIPIEIIDTTFAPDTIIIHDTVIVWNDIPIPLYIVIDSVMGTQTPVTDDAPIIDANGLLLLTALTANAPFAIYSVDGSLLLRATATPAGTYRFATLPPAGTYLLWHEGKWSKFTHN